MNEYTSLSGTDALQFTRADQDMAAIGFEFTASLDLNGGPARECDKHCTSTVPRFECSVTDSRNYCDAVE